MRRLYRSRYDKKIAGVCGGLGNYFRVDPNAIRLLLVFLCVLTAVLPMILVYLVTALVIPLEPRNSPALDFKRLYRARNDRVVAGICGGLAKLLKMDPMVLRLIFIVTTLVSGFVPMLVTYLVGTFIIPEKKF